MASCRYHYPPHMLQRANVLAPQIGPKIRSDIHHLNQHRDHVCTGIPRVTTMYATLTPESRLVLT